MFQLRKYHLLFLILIGLFLAGAWLRPVWYDDAGHYMVIEQGFQTGNFCHPTNLEADECNANSPFITLGAPLNHTYSAWMHVFGLGMGTARLCTILFSLMAFVCLFDLVKTHFSSSKASWTLLLLMGNIQIITYGAEVLGEMPMLAGLLAGLSAFLRWRESRKWYWAFAAVTGWLWAVFCKAYIALPLATSLGMWILISTYRKERPVANLLVAFLWGSLLTAGLIIESGGWEPFLSYLKERSSYGNEFFAFNWTESLRFLAFKPLILLGTVALLVRIYYQKRGVDFLLGVFHLTLFVFFLCSAGYDRFGMLLLFIPAIYLSEFCLSLWKKLKGNWGYRLVFSLGFAVLFIQQTPLILWQDWPGRAANETQWRMSLKEIGTPRKVFTYDQHYGFLSKLPFRLPEVVPSNQANCQVLALGEGEWLLAGPYAQTEYQHCISWESLELVGEVEDRTHPVSVYRKKGESN